MKLLPTPYRYQKTDSVKELTAICLIPEITPDDTICWSISVLKEVYTFSEDGEKVVLRYSEDAFFAEKNAQEQGYILKRGAEGITLLAQSSAGFLYGMMTLKQLRTETPAEFIIYDRPKIRFRGNMNTFWAESGVWSYDFGDGLENAVARLKLAIDQAALAKLNMMYVDAFGYRCQRFPGYDETMRDLAAYAKVRCVRFMAGGYGMSYGMVAHGDDKYMGKAFQNRYPYPDGEIYDCLGTGTDDEAEDPEKLQGRSYGTCLTNQGLNDDKIAEIREYIQNTGIRILYMHNMDSPEIHEPLWLSRCPRCRQKYPNDSLYAQDGAAGAFAAFYDYMLSALLPEFPDLVICPISPGYTYTHTRDEAFDKNWRFWAAVMEFMTHKQGIIPLFRELMMQHNDNRFRFDIIDAHIPVYGCAYFPGGDGFYSDKIFMPSGAYIKTMRNAELVLCSNGGALQKATQYANAEYLWNPDNSGFWNAEIPATKQDDVMLHYNQLRTCIIRPQEIYGEDGLLETACALLFGQKYAKRIADVFRLQGEHGECPIFTACNVEIWTNWNYLNLRYLWDKQETRGAQEYFYQKIFHSGKVTYAAKEILDEILAQPDAPDRMHLTFLRDSCAFCGKMCDQLSSYLLLYMEADLFFEKQVPVGEDFTYRAQSLISAAESVLQEIKQLDAKPFDPLGGLLIRRQYIFEFIVYCTGQILQSLETNQRIPPNRRPLVEENWW